MTATTERLEGSGATREVIDFGGHFYTDRVPHRPEKFDAYDDLVGPAYSDPEAYAEVQRAAGITGTVLAAPVYVQRGAGPEVVAEANDVLLEVADEHDHFVGALASLPYDEPGETAAAEFERCLEAGFVGGVVETLNDDGVELIDPEVEPIFEVADRTGAPLFVHPRAGSSLHPEVDVLDETYRHNSIFGREVTLMDSMCKVIHEGVLDRYPNLDLVYDHTGGNIASNLGRLEYQLDAERWPTEHERMKGWDAFREQLEERIYLKMSGYYGYHAPLRAALEEFPAENVLFGTDFPFEVRTPEELAGCVETVDDLTSLADGRRILAGNCRELFGLD